jgi:hypothetical protein
MTLPRLVLVPFGISTGLLLRLGAIPVTSVRLGLGTWSGWGTVGDVVDEAAQQDLRRNATRERIPAGHHLKPSPLFQLTCEVMKSRGPFRRVGSCRRLGREIQPAVQVAAEAGEALSLLVDPGLHQITRRLAQLEVLAPEPVEPERGSVTEAHYAAPGAMCSFESDFRASWESALW